MAPEAVAETMVEHKVDTPVGEVRVRVSLPAGQRPTAIVLLVHGKSPAPAVIWEWGCVIEPLRQRKVACVLPNLHSCERTAPMSSNPDEVLAALEAIASWARAEAGDAPLLVFGKSWGGGHALRLAARAEGVKGVCLACPSTKMQNLAETVSAISSPVLLAWARDDEVIPFASHEPLLAALRTRAAGATVFAPAEQGGHSIAAMAEADDRLASKLANWPDLALGPLAGFVPPAGGSPLQRAPGKPLASSPMASMAADMGELEE